MLKVKLNQEEYEKQPDAIKAEYEADGESYVVQVDGMKTQEDVDKVLEAKNQEKRLRKEAEDKLKTVEQEKHTLSDKIKVYESDETKKLSSEERVEFERLKRELETKTQEHDDLQAKYGDLESTHTTDKIVAELTAQAEGILRPEAIKDTVSQLAKNFTLSDGKVLTNSDQGDKSGLEARAYLSDFVKDRSYLTPQSSGAGAGGGQGSGGRGQDGESSMQDIVQDAWSGNS